MNRFQKKLPGGIESFNEMRSRGYYYVDKTRLIADLIDTEEKVILFTRPRRFGKTLTLSMLKSFFEIGTDKSIFEGLAVRQDAELCENHMGKYPVISISLKDVEGETFEVANSALNQTIQKEARYHQYLLASDKLSTIDKHPFEQLFENNCDKMVMVRALQIMSELLEKHYEQKVILLIDEYDVPLNKAYQNGYYKQMVGLIRAMLGAVLKTNDSLFFAVLTGCMRVSKESIFTGLNNMMVNSISDTDFDEYFGFTDQEVSDMLSYYGLEQFHGKIRDWYDGYRFGEQDVYCPWDVLKYCKALCKSTSAKPKSYWINSSGNDIIRQLIEKSDTRVMRQEIGYLIEGGEVTKVLNENLTYNEIDEDIDNIWSLLYMTGYLTATEYLDENQYRLRIPNYEVKQIYTQQVLKWFRNKVRAKTNQLTELYDAFENVDTNAITNYLNNQLQYTISFYDANEAFFHGFLVALLNTCANWLVISNRESGNGRSDITVTCEERMLGFVIEVKNVKNENELETACETAIRQIKDKDYAASLRSAAIKAIWGYGIAFCGKKCMVVAKQMY